MVDHLHIALTKLTKWMLNVVLQVFTEEQSIVISIKSCVMYTYLIS